MRSILAYMFMFVIVSVQFVDLAVINSDHSQAYETHVVFDGDAGKLIPAEKINCADCDSLNHMSTDFMAVGLAVITNSSKRFQFAAQISNGVSSGPPVPPPLS